MAGQTVNPLQQNAMARAMLLQTGMQMVKRIAPITGVVMGQALKLPLQRMGIMTGVLLQFTVPVTLTVGAATPSPVGPWNIVQQVKYTDFAGVDRTRTNGAQLWQAQSLKARDALSAAPKMDGAGAVVPLLNYNTNILKQPTAVSVDTIQFSLYVPMAYDPQSDLTGAVLTQTNVGEHYISLQIANALVNADPWIAPYTAGTIALGAAGITVEAFQHYIQPQSMAANQLPILDLSTIYGFEGGYATAAGIAANQSTYINYPNNRSILSTLINFENGSAFTLNETDIAQITLMANSNTNLREMTPRYLREMQRNIMQRDLPSGAFYLGSRRQPILTQLYANVQAKMDVLAVNAGVTQFVSQFEVQYPSGSPLPGITG